MNNHFTLKRTALLAAITSVTAFATQPVMAQEFGEVLVRIEVNATDGDVGFHALLDADAWRWLRLDDADGNKVFNAKPFAGARTQGMTEVFFESSEPVCVADPEEPDVRVQTLAQFVDLFPEGEYVAHARTLDNEKLRETTDFTYDIPAAPDIELTEDMTLSIDDAVIMWEPGDDLGEDCHDQSLIDNGTITDHADVEVVRWEVVVEPAEDDDLEFVQKFTAQVPGDQMFVTVPADFLQSYFDQGITTMKFEVGGMEESGNQTFSEGEFEIE
ncbi:MAG TPA: hypothetical protein VJ984_15525 [Xanthomonadales bacterium]|nr:hypothetical protein [Xanthomonadales bacterium]